MNHSCVAHWEGVDGVTVQTISLIVGAIFIAIALVGGGVTVKEVSVPPLPKAGRISAGVIGVIFICYGALVNYIPILSGEPGTPSPTGAPEEILIYADGEISISRDKVRVAGLKAFSQHNPPHVNDRITIKFSLQNDTGQLLTLRTVFAGARDPANENKDFGEGVDVTLAPSQGIGFKSSIIVTESGVWQFWPCYTIGDIYCPNEWRSFQVAVVE